MYQDELTLDFKDLARRCLGKWKFVLICMLVCAIVVDGAGALSSVKKANAAKMQIEEQKNAQDETQKLITLKEYMSDLTDREISEVQTAFSSYKSYQQEYINGLEYCQNSVRMQLDPTSIPTLRISYFVDNHYETTYPVISKKDTTSTIIAALAEKIRSEEVSQQIADSIGLADGAAYAQELISVDDDAQEQSLLSFTIIAENKEDCQKIAEIVKQTISAQTDAVRAVCGNFDITLTTEQYMEETDSNLMMEKQSKMLSLNNLKNSINNLTAGMTEEQVTYYKALRDNEDSIILEDPETEQMTDAAEEQTIEVPAVSYVKMKWLILGMVVGAFVGFGWIALCYILASTLRTASDMEDAFDVSVLGCVTDKSKKKLPVFKSRYDDFDTEKQLQMLAAKICAVAEKEQTRQIFIGGTGESEKMQSVCKIISILLKEKDIICSSGYSLLYDEESVQKMTEMNAVVLVEQIDVSRYEEIQKVKELCLKCHMVVLGCAIVE